MKLFRPFLAVLVAMMCLPLATASAGEFPDDWFFPVKPDQRQKLDALVGKPAPPLKLTDWVNGEVTEADMKGKVVVVDVWATWCGPCIASIPHNNEIMEKYKDKGVLVVGVCSSKNGQDKMADVAKDKGMKYPTGKDSQLQAQNDWNVMFYPTYAVVDRSGKVRAIGLTPDGVEKVVEKLVEEKATADAGATNNDGVAKSE
jgi:thiol-disulfide isomerase/thioredoxin